MFTLVLVSSSEDMAQATLFMNGIFILQACRQLVREFLTSLKPKKKDFQTFSYLVSEEVKTKQMKHYRLGKIAGYSSGILCGLGGIIYAICSVSYFLNYKLNANI